MKIERIVALGMGLSLFFATLVPGQTVAEAAKKERERREALKGKQSEVVTNADLLRTKKKPAIIQPASSETLPAEAPDQPIAEPAPATPVLAAPEDLRAEQAKLFDQGKLEIESRLKTAQELASLLQLKMTALQQQFYNFNNTTSRDQIQRDISDTYQKLQAAIGEETKIKDELSKFLAAGPAALTPIR
jgi:hypothetical protein